MSSSVTIQISRNRNVARDRSIAVLKLNKLTHLVGQPVMVKYFSEPGISDKIDTLFALGIKNGVGEDCYKIISLSGLELIRDVVYHLPDISQLIHGELFIYKDENNTWNYVFEEDNERQVVPIKNLAPTVFVNIEDKFRWFWNGQNLKREDEFYSDVEMNNLLDDLSLIIGPPKLEVYSQDGYLFPTGETKDIRLTAKVTKFDGEDITGRCKFYIDKEKVEIGEEGNITIVGATKTKDYLIEASITSESGKVHTYSVVLPIEFGFKFFYGPVPEDWELGEENLISLENKIIQSRKTVRYSSINLNYEKLVYSYPEFYGELIHIFDEHGLDYLEDYSLYKLPLSDGMTYNVYIKNDAVSIIDFEQSYQFVKNDDEEEVNGAINKEQYDEVIKAWNNQNTPGGIVVVNDSGKIPNNLIEGQDFNSDYSFVSLVGFLDNYPQDINMNIGDKWYNTVEKTIYTATSSNTGSISKPTDNTIYLNNTDRLLYLWANDNMSLISIPFEFEILEDVTDILD